MFCEAMPAWRSGGYFEYFIDSNQITIDFGAESRPNTMNLGTKSHQRETQKFDKDHKRILSLFIWKLSQPLGIYKYPYKGTHKGPLA